MSDLDRVAPSGPEEAAPPLGIRYEQDSYGWAMQQIAHLRAGNRDALDLQHLAQTLAGITLQDRTRLKAAVEEILEVLLKWDHDPEARLRAWSLTVHQQRRRISKQIRRQPGLLVAKAEVTRDAYAVAREAASKDLKLGEDDLPDTCPYGWAEITGREITWPDA